MFQVVSYDKMEPEPVLKNWIERSNISDGDYCWRPLNFEFKLKNMAPPPLEIDLQERKEWQYLKCEVLFNNEVFKSLEEARKAISASKNRQSKEPTQEPTQEPAQESAQEPEQEPAQETAQESAQEPDEVDEMMEKWVKNRSSGCFRCMAPNNDKHQCETIGFQPPIAFEDIDWKYVSLYNNEDLKPGYEFISAETIQRKYNKFPFCHPGPERVTNEEYMFLADSIIQKVVFKNEKRPRFVVRWIGYEDEYNTVEPERNVKGTALLELFNRPVSFTACRSNYGCLIRRSKRLINKVAPMLIDPAITPNMNLNTRYEQAITSLDKYLKVEQYAGRYVPEIGFFSNESVIEALNYQRKFIIDTFLPLVQELNSPGFVIDGHYLGQMFGNLQSTKEFKIAKSWCITNPSTIKTFVERGLSKAEVTACGGPQYVSFLSCQKHRSDEKRDKKHLDLHMCVYTVRSYGGDSKDGIFYDPSPMHLANNVPKCIGELKKPVLKSNTRIYGTASQRDDCVYKCMMYLIGLATKSIEFTPSKYPCSTLDIHMAKRGQKRKSSC